MANEFGFVPDNQQGITTSSPSAINDLGFIPDGGSSEGSQFSANPDFKSLGSFAPKTDDTAGSSGGFMTGPLSLAAVPGQLLAKTLIQKGGFGLGQGTEKSGTNIQSNIQSLKGISDQFLALASKETDPVKKSQDLQNARDAATAMGQSSGFLNEIYNSNQSVNTPVGNIPALSNDPARALEQVAGRGAQTVALTNPELGATGAGAMFGFGQGLEEGASPQDIALKTGAYALGGKVLGYAGGKLLSTGFGQRLLGSSVGQAVTKGLGSVMASEAEKGTIGATVDTAFRAFGDLADKVVSPSTYLDPVNKYVLRPAGESVGILRSPEQQVSNAQNKIESYWNDAKQRYAATVRYDTNSPKILAQEGIVPTGGKGGAMLTSDQESLLRAKITGEHTTLNNLLDSTGKYGSLDAAKREAVRLVESQFQGEQRITAKAYLEKQFEALARDHATSIVNDVNGERQLPLRELNDIKSYLWSQGYPSKLAPASEQITARTSRLMGNGAKTVVENSADSIGDETTKNAIINLNRRLGDLQQASDFLSAMNGKKLPLGTMGRYFARTAGLIVGSAGGLPGELAGYLTADKLVDVFQNPKFSVGKAAEIIALAKKEAPAALAEAERIIQGNVASRSSRLMLTPPDAITSPAPAKIDTTRLIPSKNAGIINSTQGFQDKSARMLPSPNFMTPPSEFKGTPGPNYNPPGLFPKLK